jgi:hypothetical protein
MTKRSLSDDAILHLLLDSDEDELNGNESLYVEAVAENGNVHIKADNSVNLTNIEKKHQRRFTAP